MSFDAIRAALDTRLAGFQSGTFTKRIAWPNVRYEPLKGETYLEARFAMSEPRQAEIGTNGRNLQSGLYTVSIVSPAGHGEGEPMQLADAVRALFPRGLDLSAGAFAVTIVKTWAAPSFARDGWHVLPVTIAWQAFTPN